MNLKQIGVYIFIGGIGLELLFPKAKNLHWLTLILGLGLIAVGIITHS